MFKKWWIRGTSIGLAIALVIVLSMVFLPVKVSITGEGNLSLETNVVLAANNPPVASDVSQYAYAKIEPSGCGEFHGNVMIRFDFFLKPEAPRYVDTYVNIVDTTSPEYLAGYSGKTDEEALPRIWQNNPFHSHFCYFRADVTNKEIEATAYYHLGNFYEAWTQEWDKVQGGMRHGWDTETRIRPTRWEEIESPATFASRQAGVEQKVEEIKSLDISTASVALGVGGELFPATDITIGAPVINRNSTFGTGITSVVKDNPANDTGTIDTVEMWLVDACTGVEVATFIDEGSNVLSTRDSEAIGAVSSGSKQTFTGKDMDVAAGDYIGIHGSAGGKIETTRSGGAGIWYQIGDYIPASSVTFETLDAWICSLYGTGATPPPEIENLPASVDYGIVYPNTTYWSSGSEPEWVLTDGDAHFTVTNNGDPCSITAEATNFTGGITWTLGVPAENVVRLTVFKEGDGSGDGITLTGSPQSFISGLVTNIDWELKFETPTTFDLGEGIEKTSTITLAATLD